MPAPTQSVTRLLGLNLTPGKLRGLQRISNPNGTLTMVATDQNSSMISMIKDSLKKKGQDRAPTYEEIVEAKIVLSRALGPNCSGLLSLIDISELVTSAWTAASLLPECSAKSPLQVASC